MLSSPKLPAAGEAGQNHLSRVISGLHKQLSTIIQLLPGASGQTDVTHKVGALWEVHLKAKTRFKKNKNQKKTEQEKQAGEGGCSSGLWPGLLVALWFLGKGRPFSGLLHRTAQASYGSQSDGVHDSEAPLPSQAHLVLCDIKHMTSLL